ncbi:glycosyltransferase family 2 protein [Clostridium hydrogeniformans]|uniref:glycosyltransferase family 2 protein n=1 Tax=Clostridium hydrogeniformans TaxID=349933 RepID=UPI000482DF1A|nr:glycosyltransferase family 2 protein [Clostridium hydrogeniformans]
MGNYIFTLTAVFQISVFLLTSYYLILSLFGLHRKKEKRKHEAKNSFALIVAAHNEEVVIGKIVESLIDLDYPKHLYDIFVIADNCTDKTANIAREHGAKVFERVNKDKRGKGYALEWMFAKIFKMNKKYDAVAVFDADNLVSKNFLNEMNNHMCEGYNVVQGYLDSKNPNDSWITQAYSISFWASNRLFQLARKNLGLSNQIGGTGFVINTKVLKKLGWGATCLTEDLEFTCKLVMNGEKVGWAHDAIVYDEKPLKLKESWKQRKRWMQGFSDVASRFFLKLIKKGIKERNIVAFDCALYVIQPFVVLLLGVSLLLTMAQNFTESGLNIFAINYLFPIYIWKGFSIFQFLLTPFVMVVEGKLSRKLFTLLALYSGNVFVMSHIVGDNPDLIVAVAAQGVFMAFFLGVTYVALGKLAFKQFMWYLLYGIYTLTWIPITIQGIIDKDKKEWSHTKHVRQIGIYDV